MKAKIALFICGLFLSSFVFAAPKGFGPKFEKYEKWREQREWKSIFELIDNQKFQKALEKTNELLTESIDDKDELNWTKSLIVRQNLMTALHKVEESVEAFKSAKWPSSLASNFLLNLYYAQTLDRYYQYYSYEINKREKVSSKKEKKLKSWTKGEILAEIENSLFSIWKQRNELAQTDRKYFESFIQIGNYPDEVRGTLRDSYTYFYISFLNQSRLWTPKQSGEKKLLKLDELLGVNAGKKNLELLNNEKVHPLKKIMILLTDLGKWHWDQDRLDALMESEFEKIRVLKGHFSTDKDLKTMDYTLKKFLRDKEVSFWWSEGQYLRASLNHSQKDESSSIRAKKIAVSGSQKFPKSLGAKRCLGLIEEIERPHLNMKTMIFDQANKDSIEIEYANWDKVYFRAYKVDLIKSMLAKNDYNLIPNRDEILKMISDEKFYKAWDVQLENPKNYKIHKEYFKPEIKDKGSYLIVASTNDSFKDNKNKIVYSFFQQTNLYFYYDQDSNGFTFHVKDAQSFKPIKDAKIELFTLNWQDGHKLFKTIETNKDGVHYLKNPKLKNPYMAFRVKTNSDELVQLDRKYLNINGSSYQGGSFDNLIFLDRNVFRPGQELFFKIISYRTDLKKGNYPSIAPDRKIKITLRDANNKEVESTELKTNEFGSGDGKFKLPKGRALGSWRIQVDNSSSQYFRVEEYKRPTFKVELGDATDDVIFNKKASFKGSVKYYFGSPVKGAKVKYQITKSEIYPYWYRWWFPYYQNQEEVIKSSQVKSNDKGEFIISFTPKALIQKGVPGINSRYNIHVQVLNEGGETISADKSYIVGDISIKASISQMDKYFIKSSHFEFSRTDLNNKPMPGDGHFSVYSLKAPKKTLRPTEHPLYIGKYAPSPNKYTTKGDFRRPRWMPLFDSSQIMDSWEVSKKIKKGFIKHEKNGVGKLELEGLAPGNYRLVYYSYDKFGKKFETHHNFIVLGKKHDYKLPIVVIPNNTDFKVGDTAKIFISSGFENQNLKYEILQENKILEEKLLTTKTNPRFHTFKIKKEHLGGITFRISSVMDNQFFQTSINLSVPFVHKELSLRVKKFRDRILPGGDEKWTLEIKGKNSRGNDISLKEKAEVLAYMYDKSLDVFAPHSIPYLRKPINNVSRYFQNPNMVDYQKVLFSNWYSYSSRPNLIMDRIEVLSGYGIGGMGTRGGFGGSKGQLDKMGMSNMVAESAMLSDVAMPEAKEVGQRKRSAPKKKIKSEGKNLRSEQVGKSQDVKNDKVRSNFNETAFFLPSLHTNSKGVFRIEFKVPDSLTQWKFWAHAVTKSLKFGSLNKDIISAKDLMVRSYFPRFVRQGDKITVKIVIENAGKKVLKGNLKFHLKLREKNRLELIENKDKNNEMITLKPGSTVNRSLILNIPKNELGIISLSTFFETGNISDGEKRDFPILPGRNYLFQSKFISLTNNETREIDFKDMLSKDPSLVHDKLNIKVDSQLLYSLMDALPYIREHSCESTIKYSNNFLTTSMLHSTFKKFPKIAEMAKKLAKRDAQLESFNHEDPNRKMQLIETPWMLESEGGKTDNLVKILDPKISKEFMELNFEKLVKAQTSSGGFPWIAGGPPSFYTTTYILNNFSKALEFGAELDKAAIQKAWGFVQIEYHKMIGHCMSIGSCWETVTFINYTLSNFPDVSYFKKYFPKSLREKMLDYSYDHWKKHSPQLKGMLALTLMRMGEKNKSVKVFESVLDSAKEKRDLGVFWQPEARSWLWYNDTIETQAYALRTILEVLPKDKKKHGLVKWLFLNKKLGHWNSPRGSAEVIYSVLKYMGMENEYGLDQNITIKTGDLTKELSFKASEYTGKDNFVEIKGSKIKLPEMSKIKLEQKEKGISFASATWHFSTEKLPEVAHGDMFKINRESFKREFIKNEANLVPLKEGAEIKVGDEIEVHLSITSKHMADYIHILDPRGAGFEPVSIRSGHKYDLGISYFEEVRDSGMNFFVEKLPAGEYTLKHRMRANFSGKFKVQPATLESVYAPEFKAYSSVLMIAVKN